MRIKVSDYISDFLFIQGVSHVFEVSGGMITQLLDSLYLKNKIKIVSCHHEQAAAFAADAYGRIKGHPGVAFATSGPGATNLLTGIANCYFDSSPALFITGQVNAHEKKLNRSIRQLGFQETDIVSMANPIVKKCYEVTESHNIDRVIQEAYRCSVSNRPGPVLVDIPMNIQREVINVEAPSKIYPEVLRVSSNAKEAIDLLFKELLISQKPLVLVGGGVRSARCKGELMRLIDLIRVPVVSSLMGLDVLPYSSPFRAGFIGSYGNRWSNISLGSCDFLIVLGSRLDIRQTGANVGDFSLNKKIFHIDCDIGEINNRILGCVPINIDLNSFFKYSLEKINNIKFPDFSQWLGEIKVLRDKWPDDREQPELLKINPNIFFHRISSIFRDVSGYVVDVGSHQMWAAQSLEIFEDQFFITSGGLGAMGFALPAAIGACLSNGRKPVVAIVGDGCMQMNIQEMQTIVRNDLPIKIIILNNNSLGMIAQFQDSYFDSRYQSTSWGYSAPDFNKISEAYGIKSFKMFCLSEIDKLIDVVKESAGGPLLIEVMVSKHLHVYPKLAFGKTIADMEPFVSPVGIEST